jgi:tripartite-type tricarboxylate transporter receptor subunit TctC
VSRFIAKYIPGNPKIAVQNMPGGAGTIANNYFASEAKPDGLSLMQDSSSGVMNFVRGGPTVKYDPRKFKVIGAVARPGSLMMIRNEARPRLTDRSAKPVVVGDSDGIRTWVAMTVWGAEYLGWNMRWIYGYPGSRELQLAIRQGEIDVWSTQNAKLVKDLQREGVVQVFATEEDQRREDFPDAPTFLELLGPKKPTGLAWQAYLGWAGAPELDKFIVAPEGTPDHLVKLLREAFAKLMKDPEVDKEGDKFFGDGWKPVTAEKIEAVIRDQIAIPKEAKDFITKMRQKYGLPVGEAKS